jgi:hypothetical protein
MDRIFCQGIYLPRLAPGKHLVKIEIDSALVAEKDVVGMPSNALSQDWPPDRRRWRRFAEAELRIYDNDAEIVALTTDPILDPVDRGNLSFKRVIIRPQGDGATATVLIDKESALPVPISVDATIRLAGQSYDFKGGFWIPHGGNIGEYDMRTVRIDRLDPQVREAEVILTPNPKLVEKHTNITRIWGKEIVFKHVPLVRYDLPGTLPAAEELQEVPAPKPAVQTVKPAVQPPLRVICWKLVWLVLVVVVLWLMRHLDNSASIGKAGVLLALAGPFAGILSGKFAFQSTPSGYGLFLACEITALVLGILARKTAFGRAAWISALILMVLSLALIG